MRKKIGERTPLLARLVCLLTSLQSVVSRVVAVVYLAFLLRFRLLTAIKSGIITVSCTLYLIISALYYKFVTNQILGNVLEDFEVKKC
jgi:hypothetical protein